MNAVATALADALDASSLGEAATRIVAVVGDRLPLAIGTRSPEGWRAVVPGAAGAPDLGEDGAATDIVRHDGRTVRVVVARDADEALAALVRTFLRAALQRLDALEEAHHAHRRLADSERIGRIGSYDWNILTDTNEWSDELFRIYGHEPQSFNASYDRFLEMIHPDDRDKVQAIHARAYETGEPYQMEERIVRPDGELRLLWSNGEVIRDEDGTPLRMIGVCRDVTEQRRAEEGARQAAEHVAELEVRRRQAMELNDNIVQGLVTVLWKLEAEDRSGARRLAERTLKAARQMMDDLLLADPEAITPGSLVRRSASMADEVASVPAAPVASIARRPPGDRLRVLVADDSSDLRLLVRMRLERVEGFDVVGEACDGEEAIRLVAELAPDVIVLDLAMPQVDGLQAAQRIRAAHPPIRIVVHSGYSETSMRDLAMRVGADAYVEKQADLGPLVECVRGEALTA